MTDDQTTPFSGAGQEFGWKQFILPVIVLLVVFVWFLPQIIDYREIWGYMTALAPVQTLVLLVMGLAATFLEAAVYTSLIPGLSPYHGWRAFMGGRTLEGTVPAPWDMVSRYGIYRSYDVEPRPASASIIVGGMFTMGIKYVAPVVVLLTVVATTDASPGVVSAAVIVTTVVVLAVAVVVLLLRAESWAAAAGRLMQRVADWFLPKIGRESNTDLEAWLLDFRLTVIESLSSGWVRPLFYTLAFHGTAFVGMLLSFRFMGLGPEVVPVWHLLGAYGIGMALSMTPIAPGGIGVVEMGYVLILSAGNEVIGDQVAAAAFTHRAFFWFVPIFVGTWPLVAWLRAGGRLTGDSNEPA